VRHSDIHLVNATDVAPLPFHSFLQRLAGGVVVVTAGREDAIAGATVASLTSLSLDPPRLLINLNRQSSPFPLMARDGRFGVNILGSDQQAIANRFSDPLLSGLQRFEGIPWSPGPSGVPLLRHAQVAVECEVDEIIERYAHGIIVGRPLAIELSPRRSSLVYWNGQYVEIDRDADLDLLAEVGIPLAHVR
jgi:flavin reductase (DIM6/NTAB) family NADH-FMN oxidoreductase RutF